MQTWVLTALLVLSLFVNGYLFAQRDAPPAATPMGSTLVSDLQRLVDGLDTAPEWRHRLVGLGRFAQARGEHLHAQQRLLTGELLRALADPRPDLDTVTALIEDMGREDASYRSRLVEQLIMLLNELDVQQRMVLLDRLRLLAVDFGDFDTFGRIQP